MVDTDISSEAEQHRQRLLALQVEEETHWHRKLQGDQAFPSDIIGTSPDLDTDLPDLNQAARTSPWLFLLLLVCFVSIWTFALMD